MLQEGGEWEKGCRVLHKSLLVPVLSEIMIWKERSRIRAVHMDNLRGLLGNRRMDKFPNAQIKLCRMMKCVDKRIEEGVVQWFGHVERMRGLIRGST